MILSDKMRKINDFLVNNFLIVLLIVAVLLVFAGLKKGNCEDNKPHSEPRAMMNSGVRMMKAETAGAVANFSADSINKKIVKNYSLSIEVKNIDTTNDKVNSIIETLGGSVENFYSYDYGNGLSYSYSIKAPSDKADEIISSFKKLGSTKSESSSSQDMTEQYADNEGRLQNLIVRRDRLRKMMDTKTNNLADILAVDKELNDVQFEIENFEKANKKIDKDVSYSGISLTITPELTIDFGGSNWKINTSWNNAINKLINFGRTAIDYSFVIIAFLPIIFLTFIVIFVIKRIALKIKNK